MQIDRKLPKTGKSVKSSKHPTSRPGPKHHAPSDSTRQTGAVLGRWWRNAFAYGGFVIGYFVAMVVTVAGFAVLGTLEEALAQQNGGPTAKESIPQQRLRAGGWSVTLEVGEYFEAAGEVTIKAGSLDETVATASVTGSAVTIEPVGKGATDIEVTAENSEGSAVQRIAVTVGAALPPLAYTIDTFAGIGTGEVGDGSPATEAILNEPFGVALDGDGNVYIADISNARIRKVEAATGTISTIAGTGERGSGGDGGPATDAQLDGPHGVAFDAADNLYIADAWSKRIRKVDAATGIISTIAGTGERDYGGDGGPATQAHLNHPRGVAVDGDGNIYIADDDNHRIRKVDAGTGIISTIAGTGDQDYGGDGGPATQAHLSHPQGVAVDGDGNVYIADTDNNRVRKVDAATGTISTIAGTGEEGGGGDGGPATQAQFSEPHGVALDGDGHLYIADSSNHRIRRVDAATGTISTIAGSGERGDSGDGGPATQAQLSDLRGVAIDGDGNVYIADEGDHRIRKVDAATETISTLAGTTEVRDGGPATSAQLFELRSVAVDGAGNVYIPDIRSHSIRRVDAFTGVISTIAGTGNRGYSGDGGPANEAQLSEPEAVAVDSAGNLYIADSSNQRIRRVDATTGTISTIAGMGYWDYGGDGGPATQAHLRHPRGVAVDGDGNVYISDSGNNRIRKVEAATGTISTIAGTGEEGYGGDGRPATQAQLHHPVGVAVDGDGNVFIADIFNHRIRKVEAATGTISTIAGTGEEGGGGDGGPATQAQFSEPHGVALDGDGHLYIADSSNHRIRRVDAATGTISTIAGSGERGDSGDGGPATQAQLSGPVGVAVDGAGNLYIADTNNRRIRVLQPIPGLTLRTPTSTQDLSDYFAGFDAVRYQVESSGGVVETGQVTGSEVTFAALMAGQGIITITAIGSDGSRATRTIPVSVDEAVLALSYSIDTLTGNSYVLDGGPATRAWLESPRGVAVDAMGNLYIADHGHHRIRKMDAATGTISTIVGTGEPGYSGDGGPATQALLRDPVGVAVDGNGHLYIADADNRRIRRVDAFTGTISTIAGTGEPGYSGDGGLATQAQLRYPQGVAVDGAGNLYIADSDNNRIRKVSAATGTISTIVGTGGWGYSGDGGLATQAELEYPSAVTVDGAGNLYISDSRNNRIRKVDAATGIISTIAGAGERGYSGDGGLAIQAQLSGPHGVAVDAVGNVYITSYWNHRVRKVDAGTGTISTIVGTGGWGYSGDGGLATQAQLRYPQAVTVDGAGNLYIADEGNHRVRKVDAVTGTISTIAGTGEWGYGGDGGPATQAQLRYPSAVTVDGIGNLYIADSGNHRIRKVSAFTGTISTIVGTGGWGDSGDGGPATQAQLGYPEGVAVDGAGNLYIADFHNNRIRKVDAATGTISTIAGTGEWGDRGDGGPATQAQLGYPEGVAVDGAGNLYISDSRNNRIRKVDAATGTISTIAGTGDWGYSGDGGPATQAQLGYPEGLTVDGVGNLYIANGRRVRKVEATTGTISTIAGTGEWGYSGDGGPAPQAQLRYPSGLTVDGVGNVYIADGANYRIRKVDVCTGTINAIAGTGEQGYSGDGGFATAAKLGYSSDIAVGGNGNVYIADIENHRVRVLKPDSAAGSGGCASALTER